MSELTSVAALTEAVLKQKLQENRRELKWRVESLRTFLWTLQEALEDDEPIAWLETHGIVDSARLIDSVAGQIGLAEQMLKLMNDPRVDAMLVGTGVPA